MGSDHLALKPVRIQVRGLNVKKTQGHKYRQSVGRLVSCPVSTPIQFLDESTKTLDLLVTQFHPLVPIVLGLPWFWSTNPSMNWSNLTCAFRAGLESSLPPMMVAMSCVTSALHHEDIMLHISPLFASIPKLQGTDTSKLEDTTLSAKPNFPADNSTHPVAPKFMDDSNRLPVSPKFTDNSNPAWSLLNLRTNWTSIPWILILQIKWTVSGTLQLQVTS